MSTRSVFFAEELIGRIAKKQSFTIEWMPYELRPAPQPTLRPDGEYLERVWQNSVYPMAEQLGIPIVLPKISPHPHTGLAFVRISMYQCAVAEGQGLAYTHRMCTAFFQEARHIGKLPVLTELQRNWHLTHRLSDTG